jgi:hypothetical protein
LFVPDPDFLPIPDTGSRGQKGTGSRIRNTDKKGRLNIPSLERERLLSELSELLSLLLELELLLLELLCFLFFLAAALSLAAGRPFLFSSSLLLLLLLLLQRMKFLVSIFLVQISVFCA